MLALEEFNLETMVRAVLWDPVSRAGARIEAIPARQKWLVVASVVGTGWLASGTGLVDSRYLAIPAALAMLITSFRAFAERRNP